MRNAVLLALSFFVLAGCASTIQSIYDDEARKNCDDGVRTSQRDACYDRVEANSRARRDD